MQILHLKLSAFLRVESMRLFEYVIEVEVHVMIDWVHQEEGYCEGHFKSTFFRDDEKRISLQ